MRISIWQQWSSNHSAAFTIMGKFKTVEDAQQAGDTIKNILTEVARWKQNNRAAKWRAYLADQNIQQPTPADEAQFNCDYYDDYEPTEIEQQLAKQHNVTWIRTLHYAEDPALVPQAVEVVDRVVIVAEDLIGQETWTGPCPFDELLEKLGGEVAVDDGQTDLIQVTIRCRAPNESTAARIWQHTEQTVTEYDSFTSRMMRIDDLLFELELEPKWVYGHANREGLEITFTFEELAYGRYFIRLLDYLRKHNCTILDYTFEGD